MRKALGIALVILIALVFLNDVGRWVNAQSALNEETTALAQWASENVRGPNATVNGQIVTAEGVRRGVRVDTFEQSETELRVWCSAEVPGTWVIGPYTAVLNGKPVDQALSFPFIVRSSQVARLQ